MKKLSLLVKSKHVRILGTILLLAAVAVVGDVVLEEMEKRKPIPQEPLNTAFFETLKGQRIYGYFNCIDFDCSDSYDEVLKLGPSIVPPLVQFIAYGQTTDGVHVEPADKFHRIRAISILGDLGDPRAIPALLTTLQDPYSVTRRAGIVSLGQLGGEKVLPTIPPYLEDPDSDVRERAAQVLETYGSTEHISALQTALEIEQSEYMRKIMQDAITAIENRR